MARGTGAGHDHCWFIGVLGRWSVDLLVCDDDGNGSRGRRCCRWLPHPHGNAANLRLRSASGDAITPKRLTSNSDTFCRIVPLEEGGADAVFGVAGFRTGNEDPAEDGEPDGKDE